MEHARITLLAHATDVRVAVFVIATAPAVRVGEGDPIPGTDFTLHSLDASGVELRSTTSLLGQPFAIRLRDGEAFEPKALETARSDWDHPTARPGPVRPVTPLPPPH